MTKGKDFSIEALNERLARLGKEVFSNKRLVVVDDEEVIGIVMEQLASKMGYEVHLAGTVKEGIEAIEKFKPIVALLDKNLPDGSGIEILGHVRKMKDGPETLMITGYASSESVKEAMHLGASAYLTKPFKSLDEVRAKVKAAMRRGRRKILNEIFFGELKSSLKNLINEFSDSAEPFIIYQDIQKKITAYEQEHLTNVRILLVGVDDQLISRLAEAESKRQIEIHYTRSGALALKMLAANEYHLLITLNNPQELDGIEITKKARDLQPDLSIFIQSADNSLDAALTSVQAGAREYLYNPIEDPGLFQETCLRAIETSMSNLRFQNLINQSRVLFGQISKLTLDNFNSIADEIIY